MSIQEISQVGLWAVEGRVAAHCGNPSYLSTSYFAANSANGAIAFHEHKFPSIPIVTVKEIGQVYLYTEVQR